MSSPGGTRSTPARLSGDEGALPTAAFYTVSDASHFIGAVALLNSLRIVGHKEPFLVADCGLEDWQRELIAPHATLVAAPRDVPPMLLKATAPLVYPARVMALLDADVIVTRSLVPLLEQAGRGKIVAFANNNADRFFPEWGRMLGLGPPRRQTYVASGHLFVQYEDGIDLLRFFHDAQLQIDTRHTLLGNDGLLMKATPDDPFYYPDMDVLNAILASCIEPARLVAVDYRLAPHAPFSGVSLDDANTLRCRYADGTEPFLLHHVLRKPWLASTKSNVYSRLLPRLLLGPDVELRLHATHLPLRLRAGRIAGLDRFRADLQALVRANVRGRLGIRPRIAAWCERRNGAHAAGSAAPRGEAG